MAYGSDGYRLTGYQAHFTETCATPADDDPDTGRPTAPNLITQVATTAATVTDVAMTEPIHHSLHSKLLPDEHIVDAGYTSAELLLSARASPAINLIRYDAWLTGRPLDRIRTTHPQRIFPRAA